MISVVRVVCCYLLIPTSVKSVKSDVNQKKPCYPHGRQSLAKVKFANETFQSKYDVCFVSLHIVFAHVAGRAQLVVDYVLYHHILAIKLLHDDFAVLWVGMHATDSVVRNPNRIVAVLGINHKVPRTSLALICHHRHLGVDK